MNWTVPKWAFWSLLVVDIVLILAGLTGRAALVNETEIIKAQTATIAKLQAKVSADEAVLQKSTEAMTSGSQALAECVDERRRWQGAALTEYDAIQKLQDNRAREVDWSAILKTVAMLLK